MSAYHAGGPQEDPQTHVDTDPVNDPDQPSTTGPDEDGDVEDDPATRT